MNEETRYAVVDAAGEVVNVVVWDGRPHWSPPAGCAVLSCPDGVGPGWRHDPEGWRPPDGPAP
jgi:hypothetical protein